MRTRIRLASPISGALDWLLANGTLTATVVLYFTCVLTIAAMSSLGLALCRSICRLVVRGRPELGQEGAVRDCTRYSQQLWRVPVYWNSVT